MARALWRQRAVRGRRHGRVLLADRRGVPRHHPDRGRHLPRQGADHRGRRRPHALRDPVRAGGREGRRARHPAAAALPNRSRPGRHRRARRGRVQEREVRRDRLQPRHQPPQARHAGAPGRTQPEPGGLQGRRGRHRGDGRHLPEDGRPLRLPGRPAHGRGLRRGLQGHGHAGVFVGRLQLHPEDRDGLLQRRRQRRPADPAPPAEGLLHALPRAAQPRAGLRREHRQGRRRASARAGGGARGDRGKKARKAAWTGGPTGAAQGILP